MDMKESVRRGKVTTICNSKEHQTSIKFTTLLTYSEITVAIAAPPMPRPKRKINITSNIALSKFPAPDIQ